MPLAVLEKMQHNAAGGVIWKAGGNSDDAGLMYAWRVVAALPGRRNGTTR